MTIHTITQVPPMPEVILCLMTDLFMECKADGDRANQIKLLPMMSKVSIYLHVGKHKNKHYMTTPEAIQTLGPKECMDMMSSLLKIKREREGRPLIVQ